MIVNIVRQSGYPIDKQDAIKWSLSFKQKINELLKDKEKWEAMEPKKRDKRLAKRLQVFEARLRKQFTMEAQVDLADMESIKTAVGLYGDFAVCKSGPGEDDISLVVLDVQ